MGELVKVGRLSLDLAPPGQPLGDWQNRIPYDVPHVHLSHIQRGVDSGKYKHCTISEHGKVVGELVYAVDEKDGREVLIVACFAKAKGRDSTDLIDQICDKLMSHENAQSLRFHTLRPGLVVQAQKRGWRVSEVIMRKGRS